MAKKLSTEHSAHTAHPSAENRAKPQRADHYFTAQPSSEQALHHVEYSVRGHDYAVTASDGVFSAHGLDKGTKVLLDELPDCSHVFSGNTHQGLCVDIGCGWGPITLALAREYPDSFVLGVDVNERALELTQRNAQQLGLNNVLACSPEAALERSDGYIDLIWSNPPIRIGKDALHKLLITWLSLLRPQTGEAYWVVQKNLGADSLTAWLTEQGYPSEKVASKKGFRIIRSTSS